MGERYQESTAKTLVVFSHYPVDYLYANPEILDLLPDQSKHDIVYFGGHRHNTDQNGPSIAPNTQWLVGGGGGYGCDGGQQGFMGGFVWADGTVTTEVKLVKTSDCCYFGEREDSISAPPTGSVDVVVCEGGNCTTSVLGQGTCTRIHETDRFVKAWCETNAHVNVERMDDACDRAHTWHFVPQGQAVAERELAGPSSTSATVRTRCLAAGHIRLQSTWWIPKMSLSRPSTWMAAEIP